MSHSKRKKQPQQKKLDEVQDKLEAYQTPPQKQSPTKGPTGEKERQALVERIIQEAMENGEFDNLPGKGKPLDLNENAFSEPGLEWAYGLLKRNGFAPEWIERDRAIRQGLEEARSQLRSAWQQRLDNLIDGARWQAAVARFEERLSKLNRKIDDFNLTVPIIRLQRSRLRLEDELRRVGEMPDNK